MQTDGGTVNMRYAMTENQRVDRIVCGTRVLRVGRTRGYFSKGASENGRSRRTNRYEQGRIQLTSPTSVSDTRGDIGWYS